MVNFSQVCVPIGGGPVGLCGGTACIRGRARRRDIVIIVAYETTTYVMMVMVAVARRVSMPPMAFTTTSGMRPLLLLAVLGGALMAGTLGLWAYYGTAVFFEIVRAGWASCF